MSILKVNKLLVQLRLIFSTVGFLLNLRNPNNIKAIFIVLILILCNFSSYSQGGVYVNANNTVYEFLEKMNTKGVIDYSKIIMPKTRYEIFDYLSEIKNSPTQLTKIERQELDWYFKEFFYENRNNIVGTADSKLMFLKVPKDDRWNFFEYYDSTFHIVLNPIIGASYGLIYNQTNLKRWTGLSTYFSLGENWGGNFNYRDNWEKGDHLLQNKIFTDETGIEVIKSSEDNIEYSDVNGSVGFESKYVNVAIGKDYFNWGSGNRSQLILSDKAPSFPYIRLDIKPVHWMRFYYIHGFLNSRIPDSSAYYNTQLPNSDSTYVQRKIDRPKFYAAHILEFKIKKRIIFSIGESVVYSDQGPRAGYLIPVIFFRLVDHYYEGTGGFGKGSNSQIFFDLNVGLLKKFNFYGTLFVDEFSLSKFLKGNHDRDHIGYTLGVNTYDLLPNFGFTAEYTRIRPWVYSNFVQTQTYENSNYLMGHYIGQNSDQLYLKSYYTILRGLNASVWYEHIRRGGFDPVEYQYKDPGEEFLYGKRRIESNIGVNISYQPFHDVFINGYYTFSDISDEDENRTPNYQLGNTSSYGITVAYGF